LSHYPIASVQNRYSIAERESDSVLDYCQAHRIAFLPYGPLGAHPLQRGAPLATVGGALADVAQRHNASITQIALAWLLHHRPNIIVIPGTTSIEHLEENVAAGRITLTADDLALPARH
jgi:aryl-alcohol dehydrogenase-like predicted oxidoreductase